MIRPPGWEGSRALSVESTLAQREAGPLIRRTIAVVAAGVLSILGAVAPAHAAGTYTCGGFAPVTTFCQTGSHVYTTTISHDVAADINYLGTVESVLAWSGGQRIFRCTYTQALKRVCVASGSFPPLNATFVHRCRSLVPGSAVQPAQGVSSDGEQGGVGTWSCSVSA
jgi:hypothetical protein